MLLIKTFCTFIINWNRFINKHKNYYFFSNNYPHKRDLLFSQVKSINRKKKLLYIYNKYSRYIEQQNTLINK